MQCIWSNNEYKNPEFLPYVICILELFYSLVIFNVLLDTVTPI